MSNRFGQIFWGILLVVLDLRINGFDLLPDIIGFILIAVGARALATTSTRFQSASSLAWVMVLVSAIGLAVPRDGALGYHLVHTFFDCFMMWMLLGGIGEYASNHMRPDLADRSARYRVAYIVLSLVVTLFAAAHSAKLVPVAVVILLSYLILMVLILRVIYLVRHEVAARETEFDAMLAGSETESDRETA